jgi:hypothetical protein
MQFVMEEAEDLAGEGRRSALDSGGMNTLANWGR